ncbi:MAG TPA: TIGR03435 family protein [Vicinamibacterales bacterium]|nr:TIGR03435 family protein [Vicinamibacterales bacterium]
MKTLLRGVVAVVVLLSAGTACAQSLAGNWQGTLQAGARSLRVVFVVSAADGGGLRAVMYSIDQSGQGVPATVTLQGSTVRLNAAGINVSFEGSLSADGNSISGNFVQGGNPISTVLQRATKETAWAIPEPPRAMAADAPLAFEVATIKLSNPDQPGKLFTVRGRQVLTVNTTLSDLIVFAYDLHQKQIAGGPDWAETQKFDVTGLPQAPGTPSIVQLRGMIRQLLTDRFKLAFHRDKREMPVYAIIVGPNGHKLTRNDNNPNGLPGMLFRGLGNLPVTNATIADFAGVMQSAVMDRPVVDRTGLTGRWDFVIRWTPDESQFGGLGVRVPPPTDDPNAPPGIFTAFTDQLGLKLDPTRAPVDVVVIDKVEKPSEN